MRYFNHKEPSMAPIEDKEMIIDKVVKGIIKLHDDYKIKDIAYLVRVHDNEDIEIDKSGCKMNLFDFISVTDEYEAVVFFRKLTDMCFDNMSRIKMHDFLDKFQKHLKDQEKDGEKHED